MIETICYTNGEILPYSHAKFSPDDLGIVWGAMITDRLRTFGGKLFQLDDHLNRFAQSSKAAHVPLSLDVEDLRELSENLLEENRGRFPKQTEFSFLYLASPGHVPPFPHGATTLKPTLMVLVQPLDEKRVTAIHTKGIKVQTSNVSLGCDPRIKHRSRLPWWIALREVTEQHSDTEPLYISDDAEPQVLETATASVAVVIDGTVCFPPQDQVLPGTATETVRELCQKEHIPVVERPILVSELAKASEVIVMNSTYAIANIIKVNDHTFPNHGPMVKRITAAWDAAWGISIRK